jgi:hypothetical protein
MSLQIYVAVQIRYRLHAKPAPNDMYPPSTLVKCLECKSQYIQCLKHYKRVWYKW